MAEKKEQHKPKNNGTGAARLLHISLVSVLTVAGLAVTCFGFLMYIDVVYAEKMYPGLWIGDVEVSGLSIDQARALLSERAAEVERAGVTVTTDGQEALIESTVAPKSEIDTAFPLYTYSLEPIIETVVSYGRTSNGLKNSWDRLRAYASPVRFDAPVEFEQERFIEILQEEFTNLETYPQNAEIDWSEEGGFTATDASSGSVFAYQAYAQNVENQLSRIVAPRIALTLVTKNPDISRTDVEGLVPLAQEVYDNAPFLLAWEEHTWELSQKDVRTGVVISKNASGTALTFSQEKLSPLLDSIRTTTDVEAKDARFQIVNGKVSEFQNSQEGRAIDTVRLIADLQQMVAAKSYEEPIQLHVVVSEPEVTESDADNLGITELVGKGTTNFSGSPTNRRKNIANGVRLLNGTLIKPGETFSTVKSLSPIEVSNGFFSELVIKGNRTIPEVGGGLCQVSTTLFRTALNAGLPIAARTNHSYRVSYYEPPVGMDATIYDPAPDFKFTNDYGSYVLLLGYVEGDNITFELWGTKDGRVAETSTPRLYSITSPGPTKYIDTDDLAPGEQKCIERAHNGASSDFTYTVTYPNGEVKQETFYSKYKAWQAVCLVGKSV